MEAEAEAGAIIKKLLEAEAEALKTKMEAEVEAEAIEIAASRHSGENTCKKEFNYTCVRYNRKA